MRPCPHCGSDLKPRQMNHCGALECRRAHNRERMRAYNAAFKEQHGYWPTRRYKENPVKKRVRNRANRVKRICVACGTEWLTPRRDGRYCSFLCRSIGQGAPTSCLIPEGHPARMGPHCVVPERHPARRLLVKPRVFVSGRCLRCDQQFLIVDQMTARYCSLRCAKGEGRDRRRARQREAYVEPVRRVKVFERDGWCCRLCSKPVDPTQVVPHPMAPTIDHVVPLAQGGAHSMANAQTAHFRCNSIKSDRELTVGQSAATLRSLAA